MNRTLAITIAQINPIVGNLSYNIDKIVKIIQSCSTDTDLVVFPELAVTGYTPEDLVLKPAFLDEVARVTSNIVKASHDFKCAILLPAPWRMDGVLYNAALLIEGGEITHIFCKHKLPNYGVFDEMRLFTPGPAPTAISFRGHKIGFMICEDMWSQDSARSLKDSGADLLIVSNASPFETGKHEQRLAIARARIHETGLPMIYVNQCGGQDDLVFDGGSFILNASGQVILQAAQFAEAVHHTTWHHTSGEGWLCAPADITEPYTRIESIYMAAMMGLRDYVTKNGFPGILIGMSGGIDSALSAAIAVDALGAEAVHCVMMPTRYTSPESLEDARACAAALQVHYEIVPIENAVDQFETLLSPHFTPDTPGIAHENIQSRTRGLILMALSNASNRMVLSTGNKSEMAVGYATLYGDMCGGFNALKDIYKMDVFELARFRNKKRPDHSFGPHNAPVIPERIITKPPSAELRPDQKDQDSLPPYEILDDILHALIEEDLDLPDIVARGHEAETVQKIRRLFDLAEYKRRQSPPGPKITPRALGRERRYPITNGFGDYLRGK